MRRRRARSPVCACTWRLCDALLRPPVDLSAALPELFRLLPKPLRDRGRLLRDAVLGGVVADVLGDLHRAEVGAAHGAEVRDLRALGRQRLVVELARRLGIEREVELVLPPELEPPP